METNPGEFDAFAKEYRRIHSDNIRLSGAESDYFCEFKILELFKEESQSVIHLLDYGCGDGTIAKYFLRHFPDGYYNGIDISEESIRMARNHTGDSSSFSLYDGEHIPFPDSTFDVIFIANVFHHIPKELHHERIKEISRTLKTGGRVYIFEHNPWNPGTRHMVRRCVFDRDAELLRPVHLKKCLIRNGLSLVRLKYLLFFPRIKLFNRLIPLEGSLSWIPAGAQYLLIGQKK